METVFKPFVDRFSQPIILSFIVAWIFWNWKIPLGLIWYNNESICLLGYTGYEDLINKNLNIYNGFLIPTGFACLYPLILLIANNFFAFIRTLDIKLLNIISKGSVVPWELYHSLQESTDKKQKSIVLFVTQEAELRGKLTQFETDNSAYEEKLRLLNEENENNIREINTAKDQLSELNNKLNTYSEYSDIKWLLGEYTLEMWDNSDNLTRKPIYSMGLNFHQKNDIYEFDIYNITGIMSFSVKNYYYNVISGKFTLQIEKTNNKNLSKDKQGDSVSTRDIDAFLIINDLKNEYLNFNFSALEKMLRTTIKSGNEEYAIHLKGA